MQTAYSLYNKAASLLETKHNGPVKPYQYVGVIWLLGIPYNLPEDYDTFANDYTSKLWFSYRSYFSAIGDSPITTDRRWGCMLRCGQMLLAQALLINKFGRDFRIHDEESINDVRKIVTLFLDDSKYPYSIHRIAIEGQTLDKQIGQWFGPATMCQVIGHLCNGNLGKEFSLATYIAMDAVVCVDEMLTSLERHSRRSREQIVYDEEYGGDDGEGNLSTKNFQNSLLLMIPLRLGLGHLDQKYFDQLKLTFTLHSSVGVIGGRPNSAHYFVGYQENEVIFLDPHTVQDTVAHTDNEKEFSTDSYHCKVLGHLPFTQLDPSLSLAFLLKNEQEIHEFVKQFRQMQEYEDTPLFVIVDSKNDMTVPSTENFDHSDDEYEML